MIKIIENPELYASISGIFLLFLYFGLLAKTETITPIDKYVIDCVKRLRIEKQLGQEAIAGMIGVHRTFITNAEAYRQRAKYNLTHINALAFYLDISPQDFLPKVAIDPQFDTKEEEVIKTRKYKKG